ncbi:50S ribosomal protein L21e [archaeon]|nr:50S ribosomal protein L21e [archaeon]|tara:strand:+ start:2753 stop:3070 length:318 start_codon:yes stop_codon:yes gene_type:complete
MTERKGGFRRKTRSKLRKNIRTKGKVNITRFLQTLNIKDKVQLIAEPAVQKGMYFPRYHGKHGEVMKKIGSCYEIDVNIGKKLKTLIVHPIHLRKIKTTTKGVKK